MRADLEEAKKQEISELQLAFEDIQKQLQETKMLLMKQHEENVNETTKVVPAIQEVPVVDEELVNRLTMENKHLAEENEHLKKLVSSLETNNRGENVKVTSEAVPAVQEVRVVDDELVSRLTAENEHLKKLVSSLEQTNREDNVPEAVKTDPVRPVLDVAHDGQSDNVIEENEKLKELVSSLERKIDEVEKKYEETSKLSEEHLKQAQDAESKIIQFKTTIQKLEEKISDMETEDHILRQQALRSSSKRVSDRQDLHSGSIKKNFGTESMRKSQMERQRELSDALIKCVSGDVGFSQGKPVAAFTMYKCLLHWKSFEAEKTNVFDRLIQLIGSAIENSDDSCHLAYWLSNTSTLLFLLQRSLKSSKDWKPPQPTSFFGRMAQGFRSSPSSANIQVDIIRPVEAKYPALLFKQQLTAYVEKIFGILRDNFKKELSSLVPSCIQASNTSHDGTPEDNPWQSIIDNLNRFLDILKDNHVPKNLVQNLFTHIFLFIDVQLFNSLLVRQECCTFSNGEYLKAGLGDLESWCNEAAEEFVGLSWDELKHIRQAVGFLVITQKSEITYDDLTNNLCPLLSVQQQYRICTLYKDDSENAGVSPDVISKMKALIPEDELDSESANKALLLEDLSCIPFFVDELTTTPEERDFAGVKAPQSLIENEDFQFLQD